MAPFHHRRISRVEGSPHSKDQVPESLLEEAQRQAAMLRALQQSLRGAIRQQTQAVSVDDPDSGALGPEHAPERRASLPAAGVRAADLLGGMQL